MMNRRTLLSGAAVLVMGASVAACSTAQIQSAETEWAAIAGKIQSAVAAGAAYIPTIESIAATAASLFGPAYVALVQVGSAAFNQIVTVLENVVTNLTPPALASVRRKLATSSRSLPVAVGVTPGGVTVIGWKAA